MTTIGIVNNPFDPSQWEEFTCDNPAWFLMKHFGTWPANARIYNLEGYSDWTRAAALTQPGVLASRDITPRDEAGIDRLSKAQGPLLVTVTPADPLTAIIAVVAVVAGIAAAFLLMPKIPNVGTTYQSPNNDLAARTNRARVNGRIADIFGTVESTPDLIMQPYSIYENNREVEVAYMIIGRGKYAISRIRDGSTSLAAIAGSSAAVYGPGTNPNSGDAPQLQVGTAIPEVVKIVRKLNEVNGQTLKATNTNQVQGEDDIRFVYPDQIQATGDIDFTDFFSDNDVLTVTQADISGATGTTTINASVRFTSAGTIEFETVNPSATFSAGQYVTVSNAGYVGDNGSGGTLYVDMSGTYLITAVSSTALTLDDPAGVNGYWNSLDDFTDDRTGYLFADLARATSTSGINLNGTYRALTVAAQLITLENPELVNASWSNLDDLPGGATDYVSPNISRSSETWTGPFIIDLDGCTQVLINVVGMQGLYTLSKKKGKQNPLTVGFTLEVTPVNASGTAIGAPVLFPATIVGSKTEKTTVGRTLYANLGFTGRCSIRVRRTTASPNEDDYGLVVDEIKWRDAYGLAPLEDGIDFGDVTTVMSRTIGTAGALSVKERRLNLRVTRMLPEWLGGTSFGDLVATNDAGDIMVSMALDPYIGRRSVDEVDVAGIYAAMTDVQSYFGSAEARQFGYTFDDQDLSFEETFQTVAQAVFCRGYRQGRVIRVTFEKAGDDATLLLNARNIMPSSQKRTFRLGVLDDQDGAELDYTVPDNDTQATIIIPPASEPTSPRKIDITGIRSYKLGYWQVWRAWNKMKFQNVAVELEATQEAALLIPNDRCLIADLTRPGIMAGEIVSLVGTDAELTDAASLDPAREWVMFIQNTGGATEAIGVTAGADETHVVLDYAPTGTISLDQENFARATYMIVPIDDVQSRLFLVSERTPQSDLTETVRAINYSFIYYQHDQLRFWIGVLGPYVADDSAWDASITLAGSGTTPLSAERGKYVYQGGGSGSSVSINAVAAQASYTKSVWSNATAGGFLNSDNESFSIAGGAVQVVHGASSVSYAIPDGDWHMWTVTYDQTSGAAVLYLDGIAVSDGTLSGRSLAALTAAPNLTGQVEDLRLYPRVLTAREIRSIYLATRQPY